MEQVGNRRSRVPSHLRPFHHQTSPTKINGLFTPQRTRETSDARTSSSPPRFRLSLGAALKDIISKDWKGLALHAQPGQPLMGSKHRPDPVRMKDSDDYITERAANPRTGLISPSLGSRTPCRESTPNSPGDALKLIHLEHTSPTPDSRRGLFSRANEGRKINASSNDQMHGESECHYDGPVQERTGTPCTLPEDRLVVHMPSAQEPQPFSYPGYSSEQIEAFEHYRRKARRVSSDGYDRRLLQNSRIPSSSYSPPDHEHSPEEIDSYPGCPHQGHHFRPYAGHNGLPKRPQPQLVVRKRTVVRPVCQAGEGVPTFADSSRWTQRPAAEMHDSIANPVVMSDAKLTIGLDERHGTSKKTLGVRGACHDSKLAQPPHTASDQISKRSCMAPRTRSFHDAAKGNHDDKNNAHNVYPKADSTVSDMTDLRSLPRVTLVRPEHAAMPVSHGISKMADGSRKCSLGCHQDPSSGECLELRKMSLPATSDRLFSRELLKSQNETAQVSAEKAEEVLLGLAAWLLCYVKGIQMPQSDLIETLRSPHTTARDKVDALKGALSLAGHVLAVGTALAMIWQLSAAVIQLLQIALWPLAVPFRILKWLMGAT